MYRKGQGEFKFFVGVGSLAQIATREDRVCVLNILGGESREVTPTGHVYSGGNVVFGTAPGKRGQRLATAAGDVPVGIVVSDRRMLTAEPSPSMVPTMSTAEPAPER